MSVATLILVCQGATTATREAAFPSPDAGLAPDAVKALPRLATTLGHPTRVGAAPSRAARDTAAALAATVESEPDLRDCDYGAWTGRALPEVAQSDPAGAARWLSDLEAAPHGGEPLGAVLRRAAGWLAGHAAQPSRRIAVVPPSVLRALVVAALDLPGAVFWRLDATPLAISRLTAQDGRWRLAGYNAAARLMG